jgi:hypothetical protein
MGPWLRVGRRLEWAFGLFAIAVYGAAGFMLARRAPPAIQGFVWILWATFVFPFSFAALLVGRWMRRAQTAGRPLEARLLFYLAMALVVGPADRVWAEATGWNLSHILLGDVAILALLIAITEFQQWRKRHLPGS